MNRENKLKFTTSSVENILNEIKCLLVKLIGGGDITFNQFTGILDKDNRLLDYNRKSLLDQRERFFKEKEDKRSKRNSKEIKMPLENFINFLDFLAQREIIDLEKFRGTVVYCIETGIFVGK